MLFSLIYILGKSYFLSYLVVPRLLDGRKTIHINESNQIWFFGGRALGVVKLNRIAQVSKYMYLETAKRDCWILVDTTAPDEIAFKGTWFVIQASSPRKGRYKSLAEQNGAQIFYMEGGHW